MSLFTTESLETLRQRVDLVDFLSSHMELKRSGATYKGLCPFHDEKSPSFMVRQGDKHYHCFGCGAHGDAITFLMERLHMTFTEAVESLASKYGVSLHRAQAGDERVDQKRKQLRQALRDAAHFYHHALLHLAEAADALHYLFERGITWDFIRRFGLGFASASKGFGAVMDRLGHSTNVLKEAGLIGSRGSDFFIDRILFPIRDASGNVVAFSGRRYREGASGGKYINTPETPLFHKSDLLFGLYESRRRIARERRALLVEGQLDCLRLIDSGLDFAVAPLGTAFGEGHVQLLVQLGVRNVVIAFDGDGAGREAAAKAGDLLLKQGIGVSVAALPEGADPDSLVLERGPEAALQLFDEGRDYVTFLVEHLGGQIDATSPAGKGELARDVTRRIREWTDPVIVHESLRCLARLLDIPEEMVGVGQRPLSPTLQLASTGRISETTSGNTTEDALEADILRWLVLLGDQKPEIVSLAREHLHAEAFQSAAYREIFKCYMALAEAGEERDLMALAIRFGEGNAQETLAQILKRRVNKDRVESLYCEALQRLLERNWMFKREQIRHQIQGGTLADDQVMALIREFDVLKEKRPQVVWPDSST